jgi:hypothetical protein
MRRANQLSLILVLAIAACNETVTPTSPIRAASTSAESKNPVNINVITTIYDADALGASLLTESDDDNGSGFATYAPISGVHGGLTSQVVVGSGWQLYIGNQTLRTLHLMLADAGLPFADGFYWSSVEMASRCVGSAGETLDIQSLTAGASYDNCSLILDFDYGKPATTYKLAMGPTFANTGRASVICNAVASGSCSNWTIQPNDAAPNARVAILTDGAGTTSLDGKFYTNSYRVGVAK